MDPVILRRAGNLLREVVISRDDPTATDYQVQAMVPLLSGLELTPMQAVAMADRLLAVATVSRVLLRSLVPPGHPFHDALPVIIDRATDLLAMRDAEGS